MIKEIKATVQTVFAFMVISVLAFLTSCESPTKAIEGTDTSTVASIYLTRHVSYDTVTVYKNGREWAGYQTLLNTSHFDEETMMMKHERHDTIQIEVPYSDSVTIGVHSLLGEHKNTVKLVPDSVYILNIE